MNYSFIALTSCLLQSHKELAKSVSFHSDTIPEDGKAAAAPQAGATAAVTLGSAYVKVIIIVKIMIVRIIIIIIIIIIIKTCT